VRAQALAARHSIAGVAPSADSDSDDDDIPARRATINSLPYDEDDAGNQYDSLPTELEKSRRETIQTTLAIESASTLLVGVKSATMQLPSRTVKAQTLIGSQRANAESPRRPSGSATLDSLPSIRPAMTKAAAAPSVRNQLPTDEYSAVEAPRGIRDDSSDDEKPSNNLTLAQRRAQEAEEAGYGLAPPEKAASGKKLTLAQQRAQEAEQAGYGVPPPENEYGLPPPERDDGDDDGEPATSNTESTGVKKKKKKSKDASAAPTAEGETAVKKKKKKKSVDTTVNSRMNILHLKFEFEENLKKKKKKKKKKKVSDVLLFERDFFFFEFFLQMTTNTLIHLDINCNLKYCRDRFGNDVFFQCVRFEIDKNLNIPTDAKKYQIFEKKKKKKKKKKTKFVLIFFLLPLTFNQQRKKKKKKKKTFFFFFVCVHTAFFNSGTQQEQKKNTHTHTHRNKK
jgi:hypothetical protein